MPDLGEPLSRRERDVLQAMAQGASNKEIASELVISPNTVKVHVRNIFTKMGASSRTEATTLAMQQGLLTNGQADAAIEPVETNDAEKTDQPLTDTVAVNEVISAETTPTSSSKRLPLILAALLGLTLIASAAYFILQEPPAAPAIAIEPAADVPLAEPGWSTTQPLTEARSGMTLTSIGPDIYQIGGTTNSGISDALFRFDTRSRTWHSLAAKPTAVTNAGAAIAVGQIYVVGGETDAGPTATVEAYSPSNDAWRTVASLPLPLAGAAVVSSGERIYVFGGTHNDTISAAAYVYDPLDDSWRPLPAMPQPRSESAGTLLADEIYILGGSDGENELKTCLRFNPDLDSESWSTCPDMLEARSNLQVVHLARKLYVIGGGSTKTITYGEVYDSESATWKVLNVPAFDSAENWLNPGMAVVETRIYIAGGEQDGVLQSTSYFYNALDNRIFIPRTNSGE